MDPLACVDKVRVGEVEGSGQGWVDNAEEVFHPRGTKGNVVELSCEFLCLLDFEGVTVRAPGDPEHFDGGGDKLRWGANGHAV
jgi:hypothetical protein